MLISEDVGDTFHFATFNLQGAPDPSVYPITQAGEFTECEATLIAPKMFAFNLRLTIHTALNSGGSLTGLPLYVHATRILTQAAAVARSGKVYLAWSNSTSLIFGDPAGKSNVLLLRSEDGGKT